jgi:hypothetical protein
VSTLGSDHPGRRVDKRVRRRWEDLIGNHQCVVASQYGATQWQLQVGRCPLALLRSLPVCSHLPRHRLVKDARITKMMVFPGGLHIAAFTGVEVLFHPRLRLVEAEEVLLDNHIPPSARRSLELELRHPGAGRDPFGKEIEGSLRRLDDRPINVTHTGEEPTWISR